MPSRSLTTSQRQLIAVKRAVCPRRPEVSYHTIRTDVRCILIDVVSSPFQLPDRSPSTTLTSRSRLPPRWTGRSTLLRPIRLTRLPSRESSRAAGVVSPLETDIRISSANTPSLMSYKLFSTRALSTSRLDHKTLDSHYSFPPSAETFRQLSGCIISRSLQYLFLIPSSGMVTRHH